jgi:putative toxin-antitoxin system antitoxin component (TIGR02293 family)
MDFENFRKIADTRLTGETLQSERDLMAAVKNRIPLEAVLLLRENGLSEAEIDALVIPSRTMRHRAQKSEALTVDESDKLVRILRVLAATFETFGEREKALKWLRRPLRELDGATPFSTSETEAGARVIENILARIGWGAAA